MLKQALIDADELSNSDPLENLVTFESLKENLFDCPIFVGSSGWRFYADSNIKTAIEINQLSHAYTYTAIVAFIGNAEDLTFLRELIP